LSPYLSTAVNALEDIAKHKSEWVDSGQAARQLYEVFAIDKEFWDRYTFPLKFYYGCDFQDDCFSEQHTLDDLNVNLGDLGTIHYDVDYRQLSYDEVLGVRALSAEDIPRNEMLP